MFEFSQDRRNFLKLAAAAGLALGAKLVLPETGYKKYFESVDLSEPTTLDQLDLVNNPEYWVGLNNERLKQELSQFLQAQYQEIYSAVREFGLKKENYDIGEYQSEKTKDVIDQLVADLSKRGAMLVYAQLKNLEEIKIDLSSIYYELASYVQMLLNLIKFKNKVGLEQFVEAFVKSIAEENVSSIRDQSNLEETIHRREVTAGWNFDWSAFSQELNVLSPVGLAFFSADGSELEQKPYVFETDAKLISEGEIKVAVDKGADWYTNRPNKVRLLKFDPQVADLLASELKKMGVDRSVNSITLNSSSEGHVWARAIGTPDHSGADVFYPDSERIDEKIYRTKEREMLDLAMHEIYHNLSYRRTHLPTSERMKLRNLEHEILTLADPLSDLERVFNPDGDDHGYIGDNDYSITRYYLGFVSGMIDAGGLNSKKAFDQFAMITKHFTGEDIFQKIWMNKEDSNMDGLLTRFRQEIDSYQGVTKLIAQTLLDHGDSILSRKQALYFFDTGLDYHYFSEIVLPLVFAHLITYKPEELVKDILLTTPKEDQELITNFMAVLCKQMRTFIKSEPSEEFLADLFAEAMLTDKYGKHKEDFVNQIKPKFEKILAIFRANQLAFEEDSDLGMV